MDTFGGHPRTPLLRRKVAKFPFTAFHQALARHSAEQGGASINRHHCYFRTTGRAKRSGGGRGSSFWGAGGGFFHLLVVNAMTEVHRMKELEGDPSNWMKQRQSTVW